MQATAQGWLVYDLSGSPFLLGLVGLATALPVLFFSLWGGVVADRFPKKRLLMISQAAALLQAAALAVLAYTGNVEVWHVVVLAFVLGTVNAFDAPTRQAIVSEMVDRDDLMNAVALNSMAFNTARIAGPALAGTLTAVVGVNVCFLINAVSFLPLLAGLALLKTASPAHGRRRGSPVSDVVEGLTWVARHRQSRGLVCLTAAASLFAYPFVLLMPVIAREMLHTGAGGYGGLLAATGVGALLGGFTLATLDHRVSRGRFLLAGAVVLPAALIALAASGSYPLSVAILVVLGWGMVAQNVTVNTILQTGTPEALRGRVMSLFTLVLMGLVPLGSLQAGTLAEQFGAPAALAGGAVIFAAVAALLHRYLPEIREAPVRPPFGDDGGTGPAPSAAGTETLADAR